MPNTILSSREFNPDVSRAKRAAEDGPVIITDRGQPAYVLLRHRAALEINSVPGKGSVFICNFAPAQMTKA